jgi:S-adenosylmethionine synthetase
LKRKHLYVESVVVIGKESNNLDVSEVFRVDENDTIINSTIEELALQAKQRILVTPYGKDHGYGRGSAADVHSN